MTTRLSEIALSLERGDALSGAQQALDGWEARNIGAARMREHVYFALGHLRGLAFDMRKELEELQAEHEAMAQELERRPVRLSWWARIFGGRSE